MRPEYKVEEKKTATPAAAPTNTAPATKRKLSFKERNEFEKLEKEVPALEKKKEDLHEKVNSGTLPYDELNKAIAELGSVSQELEEKELRWLELSEFA